MTATLDRVRISDRNPVTSELNGEYEAVSPEAVHAMVVGARESQIEWQQRSLKERCEDLKRLSRIIQARGDEIAETITRSTGKPIVESYLSEWQAVVGVIDYFTRNASKLMKKKSISLSMLWGWPKRRSRLEPRPVGVVGMISPWNFPFCIPMGDIVPALMAGCTVVLKPSEEVPAVGQLIQDLCCEAGLPVWVAQGGGAVGTALIDARPDKIVFTGGPETGRRVMSGAAEHLIPVVMELGGKDPMLVLSDAHIENAASAAVWGCFTNSGQVCASVKRVYVEESVADSFIQKVVEKVKLLRVGDPMDPCTDIGSMIHERQVALADAAVKKALEEGARLLTGGGRPEGRECYYLPTVLDQVKQEMAVVRDEIFGPVLPIIRVANVAEAVRLANDSEFGLCASVFSKHKGQAVAGLIKAGTVVVNDCTYTHGLPETPWGGVGRSGFGRIHGEAGFHEFITEQHINTNCSPSRRSMWWFPYDAGMKDVAKGVARFTGTPHKASGMLDLCRAGVLSRVRQTD